MGTREHKRTQGAQGNTGERRQHKEHKGTQRTQKGTQGEARKRTKRCNGTVSVFVCAPLGSSFAKSGAEQMSSTMPAMNCFDGILALFPGRAHGPSSTRRELRHDTSTSGGNACHMPPSTTFPHREHRGTQGNTSERKEHGGPQATHGNTKKQANARSTREHSGAQATQGTQGNTRAHNGTQGETRKGTKRCTGTVSAFCCTPLGSSFAKSGAEEMSSTMPAMSCFDGILALFPGSAHGPACRRIWS